MVTHFLERGVLVLTLDDDPGSRDQNDLPRRISDLVHAHDPRPVVIIVGGVAPATATSAVLRARRMCSDTGVLMSVAAHSAAVRRRLQAQPPAVGTPLVVHARTDTAIATAVTAA
ncbi:hypothetical protein [Streptomyces sp. NPDC127038]|uniref:hypothetical protein n=1 Tax=Streptomyces sp. NPDC127038 TaxID=3347114 RepID=UPI00366346CE